MGPFGCPCLNSRIGAGKGRKTGGNGNVKFWLLCYKSIKIKINC